MNFEDISNAVWDYLKIAVCLVWISFLFHYVWGWFAVPIFGMRPLKTAEVLGLLATLLFFVWSKLTSSPNEPRNQPLLEIALSSTLFFAIAWVAKHFM
jgi:hypothetical protein